MVRCGRKMQELPLYRCEEREAGLRVGKFISVGRMLLIHYVLLRGDCTPRKVSSITAPGELVPSMAGLESLAPAEVA